VRLKFKHCCPTFKTSAVYQKSNLGEEKNLPTLIPPNTAEIISGEAKGEFHNRNKKKKKTFMKHIHHEFGLSSLVGNSSVK